MHKVINPKILYFGTPVVLVSTLNEDETPNLAPISSAWWLVKSCVIGMSKRSKTVRNLQRTGECVLNLPSPDLVDAVDRLALTTGQNPVPNYKEIMGYRYEPAKFEIAEVTSQESDLVAPPRVKECRVQLEARVENIYDIGQPEYQIAAIELSILRVHVEESILMDGHNNYIDPQIWQPIIMNFCEFYGLSPQIHPSRLASAYAPPERAL